MRLLPKVFISLVILLVSILVVNSSVEVVHAEQIGTWQTTKENMKIKHSFPAAALLSNGKVLVVGAGSGGGGSAEIYDPLTDSWRITNSLGQGLFANTATNLKNGKALVAGYGFDQGSGELISSEIYNPTSDTWSLAGTMETARYLHQATLLNDGRVLATGGIGNGILTSAEIFNPASNQWSPAGS